MYLRFFSRRIKDGKEHCYRSIVESKRSTGGKVVQRPVLYLDEINDGQREEWCRVIEATSLFIQLRQRWHDLFGQFEILLYDLTSTYLECDPPANEGDKRRFGITAISAMTGWRR